MADAVVPSRRGRVLPVVLTAASVVLVLAGCSPKAVPAAQRAVCSQAVIANLGTYDTEIDTANDQGTAGGGHAYHLTSAKVRGLEAASALLRKDAGAVSGSMSGDLQAVAVIFGRAAAGPGGYVSNKVAVNADDAVSALEGDCS